MFHHQENKENWKENGAGWGEPETKFLLDQYTLYMKNVGPMKRFKRKKDMWDQISRDLLINFDMIKTALQVENRYKTVLKRKRQAVDNNHRSGHTREDVPYEEELRKIASADDSIQPEVLRSVNEVVQFPKTRKIEIKPPKKKSSKSLQDTLLDMLRIKEEAKERRHQEKLKALQDFGNILMNVRKDENEEKTD